MVMMYRKVHNPCDEDVNLEPLEAGFVAHSTPIRDPLPIFGVPRPNGVKPTALRAKLSFDELRITQVDGEAKYFEAPVRTTSDYVDVCAFCQWRAFGW